MTADAIHGGYTTKDLAKSKNDWNDQLQNAIHISAPTE